MTWKKKPKPNQNTVETTAIPPSVTECPSISKPAIPNTKELNSNLYKPLFFGIITCILSWIGSFIISDHQNTILENRYLAQNVGSPFIENIEFVNQLAPFNSRNADSLKAFYGYIPDLIHMTDDKTHIINSLAYAYLNTPVPCDFSIITIRDLRLATLDKGIPEEVIKTYQIFKKYDFNVFLVISGTTPIEIKECKISLKAPSESEFHSVSTSKSHLRLAPNVKRAINFPIYTDVSLKLNQPYKLRFEIEYISEYNRKVSTVTYIEDYDPKMAIFSDQTID